jgi:hypothetical protein
MVSVSSAANAAALFSQYSDSMRPTFSPVNDFSAKSWQ